VTQSDSNSGRWLDGDLPANVALGAGAVVAGEFAYKRFHSTVPAALTDGRGSTIEGVQFALGENGRVRIGDDCHVTDAVLLCELEVTIGDRVLIGWNTYIADTDFHPISPAARLADAEALSPLGGGRPRPPIDSDAVVIEDDVYLGPAVTVLKGVRIGAGAFVEPGSMVTSDVPPGARVLGNPARVVS
jgi:acetyltransferase-like isoleucine patch superfamily enzyme